MQARKALCPGKRRQCSGSNLSGLFFKAFNLYETARSRRSRINICVVLMDLFGKQPNCVPNEAAHTGIDGGMSMKASDYSCVPLCPECHTQAPEAYHRIGRRAFERVHGVRFAEFARELRCAWNARPAA
jgi:hypothetical protein